MRYRHVLWELIQFYYLTHKTLTVILHNQPREFNDAAIAAGIGIPFTGTMTGYVEYNPTGETTKLWMDVFDQSDTV